MSSVSDTQTVSFHVFSAMKYGGEGWVAINRDGQSHQLRGATSRTNFYLVDNPLAAAQVDPDNHELVVSVLNLLEADMFESIVFTNVVIQQTEHVVNLNEGSYLDRRRQAALAKLTPNDIESLGLEPLAVYNKLKHHGIRDDDDNDMPF